MVTEEHVASGTLGVRRKSRREGHAGAQKEKKAGGKTPLSSTLTRTIAAMEERIATAPVEHAVVLDERGTLLVNKVGERWEVAFTADEMAQMRGAAVFIHNHPEGTLFSLLDILLAKRL